MPLLRAEGKYIAFPAVWEAGKLLLSPRTSADKAIMELPLPLVLCFVFAVVVGYFAGRVTGILKRD